MAKNYERYIDRFFDENNFDKIELVDVDGNTIVFEEIAVVDYKEKYYVILHPITKVDNLDDDEAFVFLIDEKNDRLSYCDDESTAQAVFEVYYQDMEDEE